MHSTPVSWQGAELPRYQLPVEVSVGA